MRLLFLFAFLIMHFICVQQNFAVKSKEAAIIARHLYHNVFVYNKNAQDIDYDTLLYEKPYLSDNIFKEKYPAYDLEPDVEKKVLFRVFADKKDNGVLFVCKEDHINNKRYFIDNNDDNVFYILDDTHKTAQKYLKKNISYKNVEYLEGFIEWAHDIVTYFQDAKRFVDPVLLHKLETFGVSCDE